ncbi:MAG: TIGR02444 family protein [Gammaproteobacteria bacterium]|nr:TIGR02444 family protein [Gammaproteobacteria bacterium]
MADEFWEFPLALYSRPGVAEYCLRRQDDAGANVNLLLFCCWTGRRGVMLDAKALDAAATAIEDWQVRVLRPPRAAAHRRHCTRRKTAPAGRGADRRTPRTGTAGAMAGGLRASAPCLCRTRGSLCAGEPGPLLRSPGRDTRTR